MIIRKKLANNKRSASAWIGDDCICFGVTDYNPCLGYLESGADDDVCISIYKKRCENANVKIRIIEED